MNKYEITTSVIHIYLRYDRIKQSRFWHLFQSKGQSGKSYARNAHQKRSNKDFIQWKGCIRHLLSTACLSEKTSTNIQKSTIRYLKPDKVCRLWLITICYIMINNTSQILFTDLLKVKSAIYPVSFTYIPLQKPATESPLSVVWWSFSEHLFWQICNSHTLQGLICSFCPPPPPDIHLFV